LSQQGEVIWLSKDLRSTNTNTNAGESITTIGRMFQESLDRASGTGDEQEKSTIVVALDMSVAASGVGGAMKGSAGPQGLGTDELLEIAMIAGQHPQV
jgi:hypothetical protein